MQIDKAGSLLCESVILAIFILIRYLTRPILQFHLSFPGALQLLTFANQNISVVILFLMSYVTWLFVQSIYSFHQFAALKWLESVCPAKDWITNW